MTHGAWLTATGYDQSLIGNFYAFPPFNRKYGELTADGTYQVPARWQAGVSNGAQCGEIIGLFINGDYTNPMSVYRSLLLRLRL